MIKRISLSLVILALVAGCSSGVKLNDVPVEDILRFEREYLDYLANNTEALTTLRETNVLDDETVATLEKSIADFKLVFRTSSGQSLAEQFTALDEAEIQQEQLVVKK